MLFLFLFLNKKLIQKQIKEWRISWAVIKKLTKSDLPELHDLEQPKSVTIKNYQEQLNAHPKDTFIEMRKDVALAYKESGDLETYKDDLRKIDIIEDTYDTRIVIYENDKGRALGNEFKKKEKKG